MSRHRRTARPLTVERDRSLILRPILSDVLRVLPFIGEFDRKTVAAIGLGLHRAYLQGALDALEGAK